ncbi:hypothetical protein NI17_017200 [Thermobifida halotolerans]|uniref:Uncharacterized protein n=1 Tax=Thermobifida halotolerans TaxID=483545 RepID=A0A399G3L9_9ACTN|nr:hypothetical protein [Thermobifida halotolerans]UOE18542.1 hypothetical protein NI17_017200 [Thermobifida halotolerans]
MSNLDSSSRRAVLVVAAIAVVVLTVGLSVTRILGGGDPAEPSAAPSSSPTDGADSPTESTDVAALLPNSESELRRAAAVATEFTEVFFGADGDREQRITELAVPEYADLLTAQEILPPSVGEPPEGTAETAVAAEVTGIRALSTDSVTYLVRADVTVSGSTERRFEYAATLVLHGDSWLVTGFYDAALGDSGAG